MVGYIKNYVETMLRENWLSPRYFEALYEELHRLDPRDFEPAVQHELVLLRVRVDYSRNASARTDDPEVLKRCLSAIPPVLAKYRGENSRGVARSFPYVADPDLRSIVERDYAELCLVLFPGGAWKSCVIMAGSILEAVLYDVLSNPKRIAQANASPKAPKLKGRPIDVSTGDWRLVNLINVAVDLHHLPEDRAATIHQVLRDYRNFVHPKKELKAQHECAEAEGFLAKGALDGVCNHFEKTLT